MALSLYLSIGESFAEARGYLNGSQKYAFQTKWYLPKKNLTEGIREFVQQLNQQIDDPEMSASGTIYVRSNVIRRSINKKQGQAPAVLVNSGFESYLKSQLPLAGAAFSINPGRQNPITQSDLIFGLSCRIGANGQVISNLDESELEFIFAKLQLMQVKSIAVSLLHADRFPEHEIKVIEYFRERGFNAVASYSQLENESRWTDTVNEAYAFPAIEAEKSQINEALGENISKWEIKYQTFKPSPTIRPGKTTLHLGLEEFSISDHGSPFSVIPLNPTQLIGQASWPFPVMQESVIGYEPGPMCFGKSQLLGLIDVLFARERFVNVDIVTSLASERTRPRIFEALLTLGKSARGSGSRQPVDAKEIAADLETTLVDRLAVSISVHSDSKSIMISGAFGETFLPLLRKRRPDLDWILAPEHEWSEVESLLSNGVF